MVRTIYVVFTNIRLSDPQVRNMKQYKFLCPYDMVQVGDMIEDDRYSQRMQVVGCTQCVNDVQDGIILKTIQPSKINGIKVICDWSTNNKQIGNMEARNISVNIEQAREWYNSGNSTLRTLALNAYTESELMGYDYIKQLVKREATSVIVPEGEVKKITVHSKLAIVAKYFNGSWKKTTCNTGYFIGNYNLPKITGSFYQAPIRAKYDNRHRMLHPVVKASCTNLYYFTDRIIRFDSCI